MFFRILRWTGLTLLAGLTLLVASSCTMLVSIMPASTPATNPRAACALHIERLTTPEGRADAMKQLEDTLYGPWPQGLPVSLGAWRVVNADYLAGRGTLEERDITVGQGAGARTFHLVVAFPKGAAGNPLVISQTFSANCSVFPGEGVMSLRGDPCTDKDANGTVEFIVSNLFGEYIEKAPVEMYFDAGLVYASFYAGEFIPDSALQAPGAMAALGGETNPTSVLMAWAFAFSAAMDALEDDPRIDMGRAAVMGHSRHGKAALLAGIWDPRIDAVIAHQSGFAGASLSRSATGERLDRMVKTYPHWLAPSAQAYASQPDLLPFDQHLVLGLIAPRRLFLGNGRRDVWSDPNSSYRAAEAASAMWVVHGRPGLNDEGMRTFDPEAGIVWWLRPGGHGIVEEDIHAFIAFLNAPPTASAQPSASELPTRDGSR